MKNKFEFKELLAHPYDPWKKIKIVSNGFVFVMRYDLSVTYKVVISLIALLLAVWFRQHANVLLILLATGYMLSIEILNSCIELLCDFQETGYNEKIKVIKDVSAVSAGISIIVWVVVLGYEFWQLIDLFS